MHEPEGGDDGTVAAAAIESQHVVKILTAATAADPLPYLVMERLHGHDLAHYLRKKARLDPRQIIEVCQQVKHY